MKKINNSVIYLLYKTDRSGDSINGGAKPERVGKTTDKETARKFYLNDTYNPYANKEVKIVDGVNEKWVMSELELT